MSHKKRNILHYLFLFPISIIYGIIISIRNGLFNIRILKSVSFDIPIISVGNITVGGTGKTPHIEYLINLLKNDFKVATLSRGYKRKTKDFIIASEKSTASEIGDEPMQIKHKFPETVVAVDRKRVHGVQRLLENYRDLNVILLDDAFQHRYIKPGLSILLVHYQKPITKDFLLPFGRLREGAFHRKRAHIIIVTHVPQKMKPIEKRVFLKRLNPYPFQQVFFTRVKYDMHLHPVFNDKLPPLQVNELKKEKINVLLVTAIADATPLKNHLEKHVASIQHLAYPDHYSYKPKDIQKIMDAFHEIKGNVIIVTTEKDAARLRETELSDSGLEEKVYYLPIQIIFTDNQGKKFKNSIFSFVKEKKKKNVLKT